MEDKNIQILERLTRAEEREKSNTHRISNLEDDNEVIKKLEILMEINTNTQKDVVDNLKQMNLRQEKFDTTINKVNENLTHLNSNQEIMKNEIVEIKKQVEKVEKVNEGKGKFDVLKFMSDDFMKWLLIALAGVIFAYFFNMK